MSFSPLAAALVAEDLGWVVLRAERQSSGRLAEELVLLSVGTDLWPADEFWSLHQSTYRHHPT